MKKKIVCAFMVCALSLGCLTACGGNNSGNDPKMTPPRIRTILRMRMFLLPMTVNHKRILSGMPILIPEREHSCL